VRASYLSGIFGIALACSGEPFTAATGSKGAGGGAGADASTSGRPDTGNISAGSGGTAPAHAAAPDGTAAAGQGSSGQSSGGASANGGAPQPRSGATGGVEGGPGGTDSGGEGGASERAECPSATPHDWELGYFPELREATTQEIHPFFQLTSRGATTTLNRIELRYYFSKESDLPETGVCFWVTGDRCGLSRLEFHDGPAPAAGASRYLAVTFPRASNVAVTPGSLEVRVGFKTEPDPLLQTDDYSFDPSSTAPSSTAPFPYKPWSQATLYVDGKLVWGTEPCATTRNVAR